MQTVLKETLTLQDLGVTPRPVEGKALWLVLLVLFATALSAGAVLIIATVGAALMMIATACAKGLRTQGTDRRFA